jgi:hypothetical protein
MSKISATLNSHTEIIIKISLDILKEEDIISIYLYGGYGRGEGSWIIENIDKETVVRPYNDYDIAIILKNKVPRERVILLENELKKHINIKWIDISQYTILDLKLFNVTIKNFDFKYASKWIYGDKGVLKYIPNMKAESISLKDVEILYTTRLWTLIGSFPKSGLESMPKEDEMFFRNQMAKAILAIVDNVLIVNKQYNPSYKKRVEKLKNYCNDNQLLKLAKWALDEKLLPKSENMSSDEVRELYQKVNNLFFKYFYLTLGEFYGGSISAPEDIDKYIVYSPLNFIKRKVNKLLFNDNGRELQMYLIILQGYIAYYYLSMDKGHSDKIKKIMRENFFFISENIDDIRLKVAQLRAES